MLSKVSAYAFWQIKADFPDCPTKRTFLPSCLDGFLKVTNSFGADRMHCPPQLFEAISEPS